ncbi:hypothetical protein BJV77DRAFT_183599 [Russula vinacea]|nr:hypothetical protein BJV77DRAFT_183599 [Russula vinacea]
MAPNLPEMHYITEPERAQLYPAIIRVSSIPSIPSTFPFRVPQSPPRTRGPRYTIGWLEFQSTEQPDPDVARPGDVWIQLPIGHRKARVYACYARDGKDWSPWVGNAATVLSDRTLVRTHPFLTSDHAQRRFYLVFNGHEFTWANIKAISNVQHHHSHTARMGPAEAVTKWLGVSGNRGSLSPRKAREERSASAAAAAGISAAKDKHASASAPPLPNRKRPRPSTNATTATESVSAPPTKKSKRTPGAQPPSEPSGRTTPIVRSGPYAKAGATQSGWLMYIAGEQLKMPTPCSSCARDKTPCSGLPGQRCGKCRYKKQWCSHSKSSKRIPYDLETETESESETEAVEDTRASPVVKTKSRLRSATQKSRTPVRAKGAAQRKGGRRGTSSRVRFSSAVSESGSSSPLSSVDSRSNSDSESSGQGKDKDDELDAPDDGDDVAVENLLNNSAPTTSFVGLAGGVGPDYGENSSSVRAMDKSRGGVYRSLPGVDTTGDEDEEEEELGRFVQMTLDGMARVQEGLRGVFTLQRRRSGVVRRSSASPAKQVAGA